MPRMPRTPEFYGYTPQYGGFCTYQNGDISCLPPQDLVCEKPSDLSMLLEYVATLQASCKKWENPPRKNKRMVKELKKRLNKQLPSGAIPIK
jgi:hypothetical protein